MNPLDVMWVGLGGGLGSVLRWGAGRIVGERYHGDLPLGTFVINISGAFVIGYLSVLFGIGSVSDQASDCWSREAAATISWVEGGKVTCVARNADRRRSRSDLNPLSKAMPRSRAVLWISWHCCNR